MKLTKAFLLQYFLQHLHHITLYHSIVMTINNRSTKAELLAAYTEIKTKAETPTITVDATVNTVKLVFKELAALASDVYHFGAWTRSHCNRLAAVFRGT